MRLAIQPKARCAEEGVEDQAMSERNPALAEAIAAGLKHIAKGLREWAQARRTLPERPASPVPRRWRVHRDR